MKDWNAKTFFVIVNQLIGVNAVNLQRMSLTFFNSSIFRCSHIINATSIVVNLFCGLLQNLLNILLRSGVLAASPPELIRTSSRVKALPTLTAVNVPSNP